METNTHPYVKLASQSVQHFLEHGIPLSVPDDLDEEWRQPKGVFVCIKKEGQLRGCIGNLSPIHYNLAGEIIQNAISAATRDPRFNAITQDELPELTFSVDVLTPLEKVEEASALDPKRYGLAIHYGKKEGVLLPDLEGVKTVADQLRICFKKGRINEDDPYEMYRFEVKRYH